MLIYLNQFALINEKKINLYQFVMSVFLSETKIEFTTTVYNQLTQQTKFL